MSGTEANPEPALGVGESRGGRGEDLAPDGTEDGTKGPAERPYGTVEGEDTDSAGGRVS